MWKKTPIIDVETLEIYPSMMKCSQILGCTATNVFQNILYGIRTKGRKLEYFETWKTWTSKEKERHTRRNNIFFY